MPALAKASTQAALALAALMRGPPPSATARCVANGKRPMQPHTFGAVYALALSRYLGRTPSAVRAITMLQERGCVVHNDHVALRSFTHPAIGSGLDYLETLFLPFGYAAEASLQIPGMPLNCRWYEPPEASSWPKVFISELRVADLPERAAEVVLKTIPPGFYRAAALPATDAVCAGDADVIANLMEQPPWLAAFSAEDEASLRSLAASDRENSSALEYAAWTLTHAHRWNHLTLLVNTFGKRAADAELGSLLKTNALLVAQGFALNPAGGLDGWTQGSQQVHLEQSSTVADTTLHTFGCGREKAVPGSFLELIERHAGFRGFLGQNARGIFDSTGTVKR